MSIYVEIRIRSAMEDLWRATQTPELHERWDLRFSGISYLPRRDESEPRRFLYETRLGFGASIRGAGETVGTREDAGGGRTSALKFWSDQPLSLIREGSGYWRYIPDGDGIRFLTRYDYRTRFGPAGRLFDRWMFRPLMGWATAWSFDRLRLWLERGVDPGVSRDRSVLHALAPLTLGAIWMYQGVVPKILFQDSGELEILRRTRLLPGRERAVLSAVGVGEVGFGLLTLALWRPAILGANIAALALLTAGAARSGPAIWVAPFNPPTLNLAMVALAVVGLLSSGDLPSAGRCLRAPRRGRP